MIHHFLISIKQIIGSHFLSPAHGSGGARATIKIKAPQKNRVSLSSWINSAEKQKGNNRFKLSINFIKVSKQAKVIVQQENPEEIRDFLKKLV